MGKIEKQNLSSPHETRTFDKGKFEVVKLGGISVGRATFHPGWKWSTSVKPIAKTESCQAEHCIYMVSGRMKVVMNDVSEAEFGPGDAGFIPAGHDAWVVGKEPVVSLDFSAAEYYAKKSGTGAKKKK